MNEAPIAAAGAAAAQRHRVCAERCFPTIGTPGSSMAKRAVGASARRCAGASLLEVLVAVSLLAVSLLGLAAVQLAALRDGEAQARHDEASWMAASIAETMRMPEWAAPMLERSRASIEQVLPGARISLVDEASDIGMIIVHWPRSAGGQERVQSPDEGPCGPAADRGAVHCIAQPFAVGGA